MSSSNCVPFVGISEKSNIKFNPDFLNVLPLLSPASRPGTPPARPRQSRGVLRRGRVLDAAFAAALDVLARTRFRRCAVYAIGSDAGSRISSVL